MLKDADLLEVRSWTRSRGLEYETVIGYKRHKNMTEIGRHSCCMALPSSWNCSRGPSQSHLPALDLSLYRLFICIHGLGLRSAFDKFDSPPRAHATRLNGLDLLLWSRSSTVCDCVNPVRYGIFERNCNPLYQHSLRIPKP